MATSLAEIRAKLQAQENRQSGGQSQGDNAIYAHWNIPEGSSAKIRFLPDANTNNSFFWVERLMIRLPFAGIKGQADSKPVVVQVPCVEMYGDACPISSRSTHLVQRSRPRRNGSQVLEKEKLLVPRFCKRESTSGRQNT
jgi:hypothetical protein